MYGRPAAVHIGHWFNWGRMAKRFSILALGALGAATAAHCADALPPYPLHSPMWGFLARRLIAGAPVVVDPAVRLLLGKSERFSAEELAANKRAREGERE